MSSVGDSQCSKGSVVLDDVVRNARTSMASGKSWDEARGERIKAQRAKSKPDYV